MLPFAGRRAEADEALSRAFARRDRVPEQERYYISYRYYVRSGELRKALEVSETWARVYPRNWMPHDSLCKLNWQLWNTERAIGECREAIRLDPGSILAHLGVARARALGGDRAECLAAYERFLAVWSEADEDLPILKEAKREYAAIKTAP
ncbi:MAG TPA: hypothetical protein VK886_15685 [Vicinamibacterales bacterium]|nr:hypothetical protein [Vicinamibacterales bacterium]